MSIPNKIVHKSGLTIITQELDSPAISVNLFINVGSLNEDSEVRGISHYVEHMLFTGTKTRTKHYLTSHIENIGASSNAYTTYEETALTFSCMPSNFKECVDTMFDMALNTTFEERSVENERKIILQELEDRNTTLAGIAYENYILDVWAGNKEMQAPIIGTAEVVGNITRDQLVSYYNQYYKPERMVLSVCGKINQLEIDEVVEKYLGTFAESTPVKNHVPMTFVKQHETTYTSTFEQDNIYFSYPYEISSYREGVIVSLVNRVLGRGFSSILFQEIRENRGLVYGIGSYSSSVSINRSLIINTQCTSDKTEEIIKLVPTVSRKVFDISEQELQYAKNKILFGLSKSYDSTGYLSSSNVGMLDMWGHLTSFDEDKKILDSVTLPEFVAAAEKILLQEPTIISTISDKK